MLSAAKPLPAVFKMPKCSEEETETKETHLGAYYVADASLMTVESCPGKILTIQSSHKSSLEDENSWAAFLVKHALKIAMTGGLLVTGLYQYKKMTDNKKAAADKSAASGPANRKAQGGR